MASFIKTFSKTILIILNGLLMILGVIMLSLSIYILLWRPEDSDYYEDIVKLKNNNIMYIWLAIAFFAVEIFITFCGLLGALLEQQLLLYIYNIALLILFGLSLIELVVGVHYVLNVNTKIKNEMLNYIKQYETDQAVRLKIDAFQFEYDCCGVESNTDWIQTIGYIPHSCCGKVSVSDKCQAEDIEDKDGCIETLGNLLYLVKTITLWQSIGTTVVLLISLILVYFTQQTEET